MMGISGADAEAIDRILLPPDPGLVAGLGANHTLGSAIADLIDNSLDADAGVIRLRFLTRAHRLQTVAVLDDGRGMDAEEINDAMTIGRRRPYRPGSLGNFGVGLKAAALGCADTLTVWSTTRGADPVGRRLSRRALSEDFGCDVLAADVASEQAKILAESLDAETGTIVVLDDMRNVYHGTSEEEARTFLDAAIERVRIHIGVIFHRWIAKRGARIAIEVVEETDVEGSIPIPVPAIDPFGYHASGHPHYPMPLVAAVDGAPPVELQCHIWPARNDITGFRMGGRSSEGFQGFYVYRADRLLQIGGWDSATTARRERQLARVAIEGDSLIGQHISMNPEKKGIRFSPDLLRAINGAAAPADSARTFDSYLEDAENTYRTAHRRSRTRKPTVRPEKGFSPKLRRAIASELDFVAGVDPIAIRWRRLEEDEFLDVDFQERTIWLNSRYRDILVPFRGGLNDAPLVKALVYLLAREVFNGEYLGSRDRDDIALWQSILRAAITEEQSWRERQD